MSTVGFESFLQWTWSVDIQMARLTWFSSTYTLHLKPSTVAPRDEEEERGGRSIVPSTFQHHIQLAASYQNVLQCLNTEDGTAVSLKRIILYFMKRLLLLLSTCWDKKRMVVCFWCETPSSMHSTCAAHSDEYSVHYLKKSRRKDPSKCSIQAPNSVDSECEQWRHLQERGSGHIEDCCYDISENKIQFAKVGRPATH